MEPEKQDEICSVREIDFGDRSLKIKEFSLLQDEAGAVVWDAGLVLSYYLAYQQQQGHPIVADRTCLDCGCGTGVVGLAAARLGASQVYLSDLPHLVPYIRENIQLNGLGEVCSAMPLEWGNAGHMAAVRSSALLRLPDVVLAADVVYTPAARRDLFRTLAEVMAPAAPSSNGAPSADAAANAVCSGDGRGGSCGEQEAGEPSSGRTGGHEYDGVSRGDGCFTVAYLSYEERPGVEELPELCVRHGFVADEVPEQEMHPSWRCPEIHILRLRKRLGGSPLQRGSLG